MASGLIRQLAPGFSDKGQGSGFGTFTQDNRLLGLMDGWAALAIIQILAGFEGWSGLVRG